MLLNQNNFLKRVFVMQMTRFLIQLPFVFAGLCVLAVALVYVSAIPDVQTQLALLSTE